MSPKEVATVSKEEENNLSFIEVLGMDPDDVRIAIQLARNSWKEENDGVPMRPIKSS